MHKKVQSIEAHSQVWMKNVPKGRKQIHSWGTLEGTSSHSIAVVSEPAIFLSHLIRLCFCAKCTIFPLSVGNNFAKRTCFPGSCILSFKPRRGLLGYLAVTNIPFQPTSVSHFLHEPLAETHGFPLQAACKGTLFPACFWICPSPNPSPVLPPQPPANLIPVWLVKAVFIATMCILAFCLYHTPLAHQ